MPHDPETIRAFEHAGWQMAAAEYDATFARATAGFVEALLDAAGVTAGMRVLDLCSGTGLVAAAAAARGAEPVGLDFSPAMLEVARAGHSGIRFEQGDAKAPPFADASFDAVLCNFGVHHLPDPQRGLIGAFRVLRPGGTVAFTTWAAPDQNIPWQLLRDAIRACGDPAAAKTPPPGGNLGTGEAVLRLLHAAGFVTAQTESVHREWHLDRAGELIASLRRGTVRTAALIAAQPASAMPAIEAEIARLAAPYRRADGFALPIVAILGRGRKPA